MSRPWHVIQDDCLEVLRSLPDNFVDAIVQDPPANISFMGRGWDDFRRAANPNDVGRDNPFGRASRTSPEIGRTRGDGGEAFVAYLTERFIEQRRVLKPGGYVLTWAIPKTSDWTATALRRAGLLIDDTIHTLTGADDALAAFLASLQPEQLGALERLLAAGTAPGVLYHIFGQGMPHGLNVGKAIDKLLGAERPVVGADPEVARRNKTKPKFNGVTMNTYEGFGAVPVTSPGSPEAAAREGWYTELKPAVEHWIVGQKLIEKKLTIAQNVLKWGTGAMNIDGCRVAFADDADKASAKPGGRTTSKPGALAGGVQHDGERSDFVAVQGAGRYPAHLVLDEVGAAALDAQSGTLTSGTGAVKRKTAKGSQGNTYGKENRPEGTPMVEYGDTGGASRFFTRVEGFRYQAKPSRTEKTGDGAIENRHPTCKGVALMRWLTRLVTPPGGLVLDPFTGSGSTGVACAEEGFRFLGIERGEAGGQDTDHEYVNTACERLALAYGEESSMDDDDDADRDDATTSVVRPFVRWVGGKRRQATEIAAWCTEKLASGGRYFEPFLGGGAVALAMPAGTHMVLADANAALGWLWWWVAQEPQAVADYAAGFGLGEVEGWNTAEGYAAARYEHNAQPWSADDYTPSARFLWILHACYNGLYRENRQGAFNCPWGRRRRVGVPSGEQLVAVAAQLTAAEIRPGWDFEDVIAEAVAGDVVYADPPYDADAASFTSYVAKPFGVAEQERLASALRMAARRGVHVIASNADTARVRDLYGGDEFRIETVDESRHVAADPTKRGLVRCVRITSR